MNKDIYFIGGGLLVVIVFTAVFLYQRGQRGLAPDFYKKLNASVAEQYDLEQSFSEASAEKTGDLCRSKKMIALSDCGEAKPKEYFNCATRVEQEFSACPL